MTTDSYHHGDLKNALIKAGIEILAEEGVGSLSLRKVAKQAGVSHAAPYSHFKDKQALIAAISTEGHLKVHKKISTILEEFADDPLRQLIETAYAYLDFGLDETDLFRITFSGVVEQERDYPALVEIVHTNFAMLRQIAVDCKEIGVFNDAPDELLAQSLWAAVHGLISLLQQGQVSSAVLDRYTPQQLLLFTLDQITKVDIDMSGASAG